MRTHQIIKATLVSALIVFTSMLTPAMAHRTHEFVTNRYMFEELFEEELIIEDWMTDNAYWNIPFEMENITIESDAEVETNNLTIEDWMTDNEYWLMDETDTMLLDENIDDELKICDWMTDRKLWKF